MTDQLAAIGKIGERNAEGEVGSEWLAAIFSSVEGQLPVSSTATLGLPTQQAMRYA
ncbi:hypothetical protein [Ensifer sp. Root258]|uniref:hypothetical protein n=1 Tax=Ensifer sp. Root258 TaxID=1736502 RepID=UPI000AF1F953|nr:hypothetical protein [Ensifer sp. Root258]